MERSTLLEVGVVLDRFHLPVSPDLFSYHTVTIMFAAIMQCAPTANSAWLKMEFSFPEGSARRKRRSQKQTHNRQKRRRRGRGFVSAEHKVEAAETQKCWLCAGRDIIPHLGLRSCFRGSAKIHQLVFSQRPAPQMSQKIACRGTKCSDEDWSDAGITEAQPSSIDPAEGREVKGRAVGIGVFVLNETGRPLVWFQPVTLKEDHWRIEVS